MSLKLSKHSVSDLQDCIHRDLLAYVRYPHRGSRCFSYPPSTCSMTRMSYKFRTRPFLMRDASQ